MRAIILAVVAVALLLAASGCTFMPAGVVINGQATPQYSGNALSYDINGWAPVKSITGNGYGGSGTTMSLEVRAANLKMSEQECKYYGGSWYSPKQYCQLLATNRPVSYSSVKLTCGGDSTDLGTPRFSDSLGGKVMTFSVPPADRWMSGSNWNANPSCTVKGVVYIQAPQYEEVTVPVEQPQETSPPVSEPSTQPSEPPAQPVIQPTEEQPKAVFDLIINFINNVINSILGLFR